MPGWDATADTVRETARALTETFGPPACGLVLGSGFHPLVASLEVGEAVPLSRFEGFPRAAANGHDGAAVATSLGGARVWAFLGRLHLYDDLDPAEVVLSIRVLAEAGARCVVLTTAAGGLDPRGLPGEFAVVADHLNLTGVDVTGSVPAASRSPSFLDLQDLYDPVLADAMTRAAGEAGVRLRRGVLAGVRGPCYETPAEVAMLRRSGADLVSMSTVLEAVAARYLGLRVAGLACVANRGAGLGSAPIDHDAVLDVVSRAVAGAPWLVDAISAIARESSSRDRPLRR